jgi:capsular exopolysaccharide synthesis family protein
VTANLALTISHGGSRVLLVDADLRRGALNQLFDLSSGPGLTELLRQETSLDQVTCRTSYPNLDFIPTGKHINNPGELFLSPAADVFLKKIYSQYDYVLFDSAPILATDDTTTLAPKIDGVLFVIRGSFTRARLARQALHQLYHRQARVLGLIVNRANSNRSDYYYYKYGYYRAKTPAAV